MLPKMPVCAAGGKLPGADPEVHIFFAGKKKVASQTLPAWRIAVVLIRKCR